MADAYDLMQTVTVTASFKDEDGVAYDPATVTLMVKDPSGVETTYTYALGQITKTATGEYEKDIEADESWIWYARWEGATAGVKAVVEYWFYVKQSVFYP
jgi:hypothetical protein